MQVSTEDKIIKSDAQWRSQLTFEQYRVTRLGATEQPFSGQYWRTHRKGVYVCACCDLPLFDSQAKFDPGTGWSSFRAPIDEHNVVERPDARLWMHRTEVLCRRCDAHLGHRFKNGPEPTGQRYSINSAALKLVPKPEEPK